MSRHELKLAEQATRREPRRKGVVVVLTAFLLTAGAGRRGASHIGGVFPTILGLSLAGQSAIWPWLIPRIRSASATGVDVSSATFLAVDPTSLPEGGAP